MRKYQRKLVQDIAQVYQSSDPLRWYYLAYKIQGPSHHFGLTHYRAFRTAMNRIAASMHSITPIFEKIAVASNQATKALGSIHDVKIFESDGMPPGYIGVVRPDGRSEVISQ